MTVKRSAEATEATAQPSGRDKALTKALLAGAGGVGTLVTGFVFWRAWRRRGWRAESEAASEPWRTWQQGGATRRLLQAAILAPSVYNSQPWRFGVGVDRIAFVADLDRHVGSLDAFRRQMHLSLGCALENLVLAARANALSTSITLPPGILWQTPPGPPTDASAIVQLSPALDVEASLYDAIPLRHTHRGAYRLDEEIPEDVLNGMQALVPATASLRLLLFTRAAKRALADLIVASTEAIAHDEQMAADSARWSRLDSRRRRTSARALRRWVRDTRDVHVKTAPLLGIIAVREPYDRPTTIQAGRLWQRLHLWLTTQGLAAQPLNQPVQRVDRERELETARETADALARIAGSADWHPTLIFRAGYADDVPGLTPRRAVETTIIR